jgi:hypothetical protein
LGELGKGPGITWYDVLGVMPCAATLLAQSFGWQLSLRGTIVPFVGEVPESGLGSSADGKGEDGIDRSFEGTGAPMHLGE